MAHLFQVNLRGIIDLLSDHLYSRPEVFVRELLQNAVDAITARRQIDPDLKGEINLTVLAPKGKPRTLEATDNGVGLTEEELHRLLATIGATSKRNAAGQRTGDFLGQFGIGLLSCFVVSDEIVVVTRSAREADAPAVEWRARADGTYTVRVLDAEIAPGTQVYLTCRPGREDLFTAEAIKEVAFRYGGLLPEPIKVATGRTATVINRDGAPWRDADGDPTRRTQALLRFGKQVFDTNFLDAIPLRSEAGRADGVAYVLPHAANLTAKRSHRVYLRRMLLSEDADNLLPDWAFFVRAVVNADDLRPTASREGFYEDSRLDRTRTELGNCLRDYLVDLAERESPQFARFLEVHHLGLKALAAQDDACFRTFIDWLPFETTRGRLTVKQLREEDRTIRFVDDLAQYQQMSKVAIAQGITLVNAGYVYDADLLARLPEVDPEVLLQRVDAETLTHSFEELDDAELDAAADLLDAATEILRPFGSHPEIRRFLPADLPALYQAGADARFLRSLEQSQETADPIFQGILESLGSTRGPVAPTLLILNGNNPLVQRLMTVRTRAVLLRAVEILYVQALMLAHQPLSARELGLLNTGLTGLVDLLIPPERKDPRYVV